MRAGVALFLLLTLGPVWAQTGRLPKPSFPLSVMLDQFNIPVLAWTPPDRQVPRQRVLLRSTMDLRTTKDALTYPIAFLDANRSPTGYRDSAAPQDVPLFYQLKMVYEDGRMVYSQVAVVTVPAPRIPALSAPSLHVDKPLYTLTLQDNGVPLRRFPIALGANPVNRKLILDRASTPEGVYSISGLQPRAEFYRAYDLNYPNDVDRIRHRVLIDRGDLEPEAPIGGEIQIHGDGIDANWTWGCIALRNKDMDTLFSLSELALGTPVIIVGAELQDSDVFCDLSLTPREQEVFMHHMVRTGVASGHSQKHWQYGLCKYQAENGLLVTGVFDRATRKKMEQQLLVSSPRPLPATR